MNVNWAEVDRFRQDNADLVVAIIRVESGGRVWASRYESNYQYLWSLKFGRPQRCCGPYKPFGFIGIKGLVSNNTEFVQQRTSWGPMQIMGAVAREYGFMGEFPELCGELGIRFGIWHLIQLKERIARKGFCHQHDLIAAYNYGHVKITKAGEYANQQYVDKVNAELKAVA